MVVRNQRDATTNTKPLSKLLFSTSIVLLLDGKIVSIIPTKWEPLTTLTLDK